MKKCCTDVQIKYNKLYLKYIIVTVILIILYIVLGCQLPGDKNEEKVDNNPAVEVDNEAEQVDNTPDELEQNTDDVVVYEDEPVDEADEKINTEVSIETYKDFSEYHFPTNLAGKTVETDNGQRYVFGADGITLPTNHLMYPNPVTPDMFNNAVEGTTSETVTDDGDVFSYELSMSGKFSYKNNEYFGEVVIIVEKTTDELLVNNTPAVFVGAATE